MTQPSDQDFESKSNARNTNPLEDMMAKLADLLKGSGLGAVEIEQLRSNAEELFGPFTLVSKTEFQTQLSSLRQLESQVADLEARLSKLDS